MTRLNYKACIKKAIGLWGTIIFIGYSATAQSHIDVINAAPPDAAFKTVADKVDQFFIENPTVKGIKQWERWKWYAERHLDPDGKVGNITKKNMQALEKLNVSSNTFGNVNRSTDAAAKINGDWSALGPFSIASPAQNYLGRVNCLAFHPSIANTIFAGTPGGGLWKSTTNGGN